MEELKQLQTKTKQMREDTKNLQDDTNQMKRDVDELAKWLYMLSPQVGHKRYKNPNAFTLPNKKPRLNLN